jgi:chaperone modulatory protein CbpM
MEVKASDWIWLDTQRNVDQQELAHMCTMSQAEIDELVDYGVLVPLANEPGRLFNAAVVPSLREAVRLRADFDLDLFTVSLLLRYLQRIVHLEQQLRALQALQAQFPHGVHLEREGPTPWREGHA